MTRARSMRFPDELIEEVKARTDLVALISRDVKLRRKGREWVGLSPFNAEKTPSFTVAPSKGFWHCFSSGEHGNAIGWLVTYHRMDFARAVEELAAAAGVEIPADLRGTARGETRGGERRAATGQADPAPGAAARVDPARAAVCTGPRRRDRRARGYEIWRSGTGPVAGTFAETYLVEARCIPADMLPGSDVLRFRADQPLVEEIDGRWREIWRGPALLSAIVWPDGRFAACHVTWLAADGSGKLVLFDDAGARRKVKKVFGQPSGGAIRLGPPTARMVFGEGLETTLSCMDLEAGRSGWAAYSLDNLVGAGLGDGELHPTRRHPKTGRRVRLPSTIPDMSRPGLLPPVECTRPTLLGDGDTKDLLALEARLRRGVRRFRQLGLDADYAMSPPGMDFNDVLQRAVRGEIPLRPSATSPASGGGDAPLASPMHGGGARRAEGALTSPAEAAA